MTTPPNFSVGQYNTAAYMNAIGLWKITSVTVGSGVSSVTVSNCFSADYNNYKIMWCGGITSASGSGYIQLTGITTGLYYGALPFYSITGGSYGAVSDSGSTTWRYVAGGNATFGSINLDICAPYLAQTKTIQAWYTRVGYSGFYTGYCDSIAQATGFTIGNTDWGTMTGGTITVYGYNKG
jgi:hypothetical protein